MMKNQKISKWGVCVINASAETAFIDLAFFHFCAGEESIFL